MEASPTIKYKPGDRVRVGTAVPQGHCRTPAYVRGKIGRVLGLHGTFLNPELLAYAKSGLPKQPLYQVEFDLSQFWERYGGPSGDKLVIDIYQHWLEPVNTREGL